MIDERLKGQLAFLMEIDKMKTVLRRTLVADGSKRENDAEHSWHLAMYSMVLYEYADNPENIDLNRVIRMVLVHDLVEVYAGDTFCYDAKGNEDKEQREREAADKLFALLPKEQGDEYRALWEEFDRMDTPDSRFAASTDRLQPLLNNYVTQGHTWKLGDISSKDVFKRMEPIKTGAPELWKVVELIVEDSIKKGYLKK